MKTKKIEQTLEEIMTIESKAHALEDKKKELQDNYNKKLGKEKIAIERRYLKEARQKAKEMRDEILRSGHEMTETIEAESNEKVNKLEYLLNNNIEEITQKIFNQIISQL